MESVLIGWYCAVCNHFGRSNAELESEQIPSLQQLVSVFDECRERLDLETTAQASAGGWLLCIEC